MRSSWLRTGRLFHIDFVWACKYDAHVMSWMCLPMRDMSRPINFPIILTLTVFFFLLSFFFFQQHLDIVSPFQLYFNPTLILRHYQLWRLATTFLFFGTIGFNFLFNMTFTYRYCRMLEEGSFRGKSSDFIMMFLFGGALMTVSIYIHMFKQQPSNNI